MSQSTIVSPHAYYRPFSSQAQPAGVTLAAAGLVAAAVVTRRARRAKGSTPKAPVMVGASVEAAELLGIKVLPQCVS